jgi:hypothetical protein
MGLKRATLVLLNEDVRKTSPNAKMRDIRFALEPGLIGGHALERGCRKTVPDMDLSIECFPPQ